MSQTRDNLCTFCLMPGHRANHCPRRPANGLRGFFTRLVKPPRKTQDKR